MNNIFSVLKNRFYLFLLLITFLAAFVRFYKLADVPVSLYWDEVSTGYNAYSISMTLKDEYGNFLPLLFKSYNDYKMPLNVYITALSVRAFGLNEFSIRLPSAFFGTLTIIVTFFLIRQLLKSHTKEAKLLINSVALLTSFLLSISPWHIQFSRGGFEANISLFFVILGSYLLLKGRKSYKLYLCSFIFFALAFYSYRSAFIFLPFLIIGLLIIWRKEYLKVGIKRFLLGLFLGAILVIPISLPLSREGSSRFKQTSISNKVEQIALENFQKGKPKEKKLLYITTFIQGYIDEFKPQFLFISGDPQGRHSPRGSGVLYIWEIPFILLGIWFIVKRTSHKIATTVLLWIAASPIPAALSIPTPHALRLLNMLPMPQLLTALGIVFFIVSLPTYMRKIVAMFIAILIFVFFVNYVRLYTISNTKLSVSDWGDGYKQLVYYIKDTEDRYEKIIVTGHYWQPYMYMLFYTKYDPYLYQKFGSPEKFHKYYFGGTSWDLDAGRPELNNVNLKQLAKAKKVLVALSPEEFRNQESNLNVINKLYDHSGKLIFILATLR